MESPTAQDACLPGSSAVLVWPGDDMGPLAVRMQVAVRWLALQVVVIDPLGASELLPSSLPHVAVPCRT